MRNKHAEGLAHYKCALYPDPKTVKRAVELSQEAATLYAPSAPPYVLNQDKRNPCTPHITLYEFMAPPSELQEIQSIVSWQLEKSEVRRVIRGVLADMVARPASMDPNPTRFLFWNSPMTGGQNIKHVHVFVMLAIAKWRKDAGEKISGDVYGNVPIHAGPLSPVERDNYELHGFPYCRSRFEPGITLSIMRPDAAFTPRGPPRGPWSWESNMIVFGRAGPHGELLDYERTIVLP